MKAAQKNTDNNMWRHKVDDLVEQYNLSTQNILGEYAQQVAAIERQYQLSIKIAQDRFSVNAQELANQYNRAVYAEQ